MDSLQQYHNMVGGGRGRACRKKTGAYTEVQTFKVNGLLTQQGVVKTPCPQKL